MKIVKHSLQGDAKRKVAHLDTPNRGGRFAAGLPDTIVLHFTAGGDAPSAIRTLTDPNSKASAHVVVGRDGSLTQLVAFDTVAWHAGKSAYEGRTGFNDYAIGIEIDNAGRLERQGDRFYAWFGREYPPEQAFQGVHRNESEPTWWHRYQEQDIALVREVCALLIRTYPIKQILGHEEIAPGRKIDPGPAFPLDKFRETLLATDRSETDPPAPPAVRPIAAGVVTASSLNIRMDPSPSAPKAADPVPRGSLVKIYDRKPGWLYVGTEVKGWVSEAFVKEQG